MLVLGAFRGNSRISEFELPDLSDIEGLEEKAGLLRNLWNLGEAPIENAVELLESKGFVISDLTFSSEKIDAFSQRVTVEFQNGVKNYYVIVLGSNKSLFTEGNLMSYTNWRISFNMKTLIILKMKTMMYIRK